MKLSEIMSPADSDFTPEDRVEDVVKALARHGQSCRVICTDGIPAGILTEADMVRLLADYSETGLPADMTVGEVMTPNPVTFSGEQELNDVLTVLRTQQLRHLPVVGMDSRLAGVITLSDMIMACDKLRNQCSKLEERSEELQTLSLEDFLTGLPNRRAMELDLTQAEARAIRYGEEYSVTLIDIDYFKAYNDYYGHLQGDEALRLVSDVLKHKFRTSDKAYRYGGEEFLYFLPQSTMTDAVTAAERLRSAVSAAELEHDKSPLGQLSISIGVAVGGKGAWQETIQRADEALYRAKEEGRNRICTCEEPQPKLEAC